MSEDYPCPIMMLRPFRYISDKYFLFSKKIIFFVPRMINYNPMRHFLQLFLVFLFVSFSENEAMARQLTPEEALSNARMADNRSRAKVKISPDDAFTLAYTSSANGVKCYYAFNKDNGGGFLILSADDVAPTILGYTDSGCFDYDKIPENMKWWLSQYDRNISIAAVKGISIKRQKAKASLKAIQPLIITQWNQTAPYNNMCPVVSGRPTYTGCVATAMAQIMYYHKWPITGTGSNSYDIEIEGQPVSPYADFGNTTYRWDDMLTKYRKGFYNQAQADAVATLMYHCGVSANMGYGVNESGASSRNAMSALVSYFNYDKALSLEQRIFYTDDEWEGLIYNELANGRPVYYSGATIEGSGHAFICDGYDGSGNFHFNWGWGGYYDGYYLVTGTGALLPDGSGIGGGTVGYGYTEGQFCGFGIQTPREGSDYRLSMECPNGYSIETSENPVTRKTLITFYGGIYSGALTTFNVTVGLMFKATVSDEVYYQEKVSAELKAGYGWNKFSFSPTNVLKNGEYEVYPIFKLADGSGDWQIAKIPVGTEIPRITITGDEPNLILAQKAFMPDAENVKADNVEVHFTLKALEAVRDQLIFAWIFPETGGSSIGYMMEKVSMNAGETRDFVLRKDFSDKLYADNTYYIKIQNNTKQEYLAPSEYGKIYFTVVPGSSSYINNVIAEPDKSVKVYAPTGILLRNGVSGADALKGLPRGLYIVDGKKVLKK